MDLADLPLRDELRGRTPYGAPQLDVAVRLNTNESAYPVPAVVAEEIVEAVREQATGLNRYPDREATELRKALAAYLTEQTGAQLTGAQLTGDQLWAANGSNETLQQILQAFGGPGRTALGFEPSYSMHPLIASGTSTAWISGERADDFTISPVSAAEQVARHQPDVTFLTSPNNPTGTALDPAVIRAVAETAPGVVVVDEAYAEFARAGAVSAVTLLSEFPRLIVTRTMSKAFTLAGARVGYLAASPAVVDALHLVRLPYHLSALTQAAARAALAHTDALLATVEAIRTERDRVVAELDRRGFQVVPSDANFVLFGGFADAPLVWRELLEHGVLVRDVGLPGWLRVTTGTPAENDAFLTALDATGAAIALASRGAAETDPPAAAADERTVEDSTRGTAG